MPSTRNALLLETAAIACPLVLIMGVRTFLAPAPTSAATSPQASLMPAAATPAPQRTLSIQQTKAQEWVALARTTRTLASPLDHPTPIPPPKVVVEHTEPTPEPVAAPAANPVEGLTLTGVLGNESGGLAAIGNKIFKIGDKVRPGVELTKIDARANAITLRLDDGTEVVLRRKP